jgi:Flp pilus assembly pilin Flp
MFTNYLMKAKGIAKKIVRDETGASGAEYAVLFVIVAAVAAGVAILGPKIIQAFQSAASSLP